MDNQQMAVETLRFIMRKRFEYELDGKSINEEAFEKSFQIMLASPVGQRLLKKAKEAAE